MPQKIEHIIIDENIVKHSNQQVVGGFFHIDRHFYWLSQTLHLANGDVIENCYSVEDDSGISMPPIWYKDFSRTLDYYAPHFQAIIDKEQADAKT